MGQIIKKTFKKLHDIDGLAQDCSISIANAMEILQSCTKPSMSCSIGIKQPVKLQSDMMTPFEPVALKIARCCKKLFYIVVLKFRPPPHVCGQRSLAQNLGWPQHSIVNGRHGNTHWMSNGGLGIHREEEACQLRKKMLFADLEIQACNVK